MEFGGREIMIVLGALVLLAIVLDVVRRMRRARYEKIHMPRRKQPIFDDEIDLDEYGSELPSGGARVVMQRDAADVEEFSRSLKEIAEAGRPKLTIFQQQPEPADFGMNLPERELIEDTASGMEPEVASPSVVGEPAQVEKEKPQGGVVVLHVMSKEQCFAGELLLEALLGCGLHYGSMKIFHRHEQEDGAGSILFSVANSVNPGIFDLNAMEQFNTPGISLFFAMDDLDNPATAYEEMLSTAEKLTERLGGELCDETRSTLNQQTINLSRERIADFARSQSLGND